MFERFDEVVLHKRPLSYKRKMTVRSVSPLIDLRNNLVTFQVRDEERTSQHIIRFIMIGTLLFSNYIPGVNTTPSITTYFIGTNKRTFDVFRMLCFPLSPLLPLPLSLSFVCMSIDMAVLWTLPCLS